MDTKELIAVTMLLFASLAGVAAACISTRAREAAFFLLVSCAVLGDRLDVNFFSQYWYRGTTRGVEVSFLDVLALCVLAGSLVGSGNPQPRWRWPAGLAPLLAMAGWAAVSVLISDPHWFGVFELSKMFRGILVFAAAACFVRGERELAILVVALGCAVCLEGALALKQRYLDGVYRVTGTLDHANSLSMYLCLAGPVLVAAAASAWAGWLRGFCWFSACLAAVTMLLTISRAGIPIMALTMTAATAWCVSWKLTPGKVAAVLVTCLALGTLSYRSWDTLKERYGEATLEEEYLDTTVEGRGLYLRLAWEILKERPFGVGLNNWSYHVSKTYGARFGYQYEDYDDLIHAPDKEILPSFHYAAPAHCLAALTAGELGWLGLLLLALIWARWFHIGQGFLWSRDPAPMRRLGVGIFFGAWGVFLQSLTEWTYRQTPILFTCHVFIGALAALHYARTHQPGRFQRHRARAHPVRSPAAVHEPAVATHPFHACRPRSQEV